MQKTSFSPILSCTPFYRASQVTTCLEQANVISIKISLLIALIHYMNIMQLVRGGNEKDFSGGIIPYSVPRVQAKFATY